MGLLEAIQTLSSESGARRLQRSQFYVAVSKLVTHLFHTLRCGDTVTFCGRIYALQLTAKSNGDPVKVMTVDNGRGPAILGQRISTNLPVASYEEHIFFVENAGTIVRLFGEVMRTEIQEMQRLEQHCHAEVEHNSTSRI